LFFYCHYDFFFFKKKARRAWAAAEIEKEHKDRIGKQFLAAMMNTMWFNENFVTVQTAMDKYEIVCPFAHAGCSVVCPRRDLDSHLLTCAYARGVEKREKDAMSTGTYSDLPQSGSSEAEKDYEVCVRF
jgi:hypothetical protein